MSEEHRTIQINGVDPDGVPYTFLINREALVSGNIHNGDTIDFVVGQATSISRAAHSFLHPDLYSFLGGAGVMLVLAIIVAAIVSRRDETPDIWYGDDQRTWKDE